MMVMVSNDSSYAFHAMAARHRQRLGWLIGPEHYKRPRQGLSFALDNDAYTNWRLGRDFDAPAWVAFLEKIKAQPFIPLWCAVPDLVADRPGTLERWRKYSPLAASYGWPLAFVVQDGMEPVDVPSAAVVFVGGTTSWKWRTIPMWASSFPRVHVGRCGTSRWKLDRLEQLGIESCDGSGFFRATADGREARNLKAWLEPCSHQPELI